MQDNSINNKLMINGTRIRKCVTIIGCVVIVEPKQMGLNELLHFIGQSGVVVHVKEL